MCNVAGESRGGLSRQADPGLKPHSDHVPRETWDLTGHAGFKNPGFATISEAWTAL
jgi:hypothetical protein